MSLRILDLEKKLGNTESELQIHKDDYIFSPVHIPFTQLYDDEDVSEELVEEALKIYFEGENSHLNLEKERVTNMQNVSPYLPTTQLADEEINNEEVENTQIAALRREANEVLEIQEGRRDIFEPPEPIREKNVIEREVVKEIIEVPQTKELIDKYISALISESQTYLGSENVSHQVSQPESVVLMTNNELIEEVKEGKSPEGNQPLASVVPAEEIKEPSTAHTEESSTVTAKRRGGRVHELGVQRNFTTQYKELVLEYARVNGVPCAIEHFQELYPDKKPLSSSSLYRWINQLKKAQQK